jgi:competence ComEA-like helix-hairpin-helix protein
MIMPENKGIVKLVITVTFKPLSPIFEIVADPKDTTSGPPHFSCNGRGDNNQDLLKDILRKIIESYPKKEISLCTDGNEIVLANQRGPAPPHAPPDGACVINVNNNYTDGSQIEGTCTFIYTSDVGQIEVVRGEKAASEGSKLTFKPTVPGRIRAYRVDFVRKKPNGSQERVSDCDVAEPDPGFVIEEVWFPPRINVNRASRTELEQISGIGPATSQAIVEAREQGDFKNIDDLEEVVAKVLGASRAARLELERKVVLS